MFHLDYDRAANILKISVKGFWQEENVLALGTALDVKLRETKAVRPDFGVLVESFEFPVQANDIADLLTGVMRDGIDHTTGRAAVVVGSHLNKLQAERTLVHPRVRVFQSLEDAEAWLAGTS